MPDELHQPTPPPIEIPPPPPPPEPISVPPEAAVDEPAKIENGLEAPPMAPEAPPSPVAPAPAETSVSAPEPQNPPVAPVPIPVPIEPLRTHPRSFLARALESIQFRKRAKLDKILKLAAEKHSIANDQVEKLLRVSDATATRYLAQLVKEGRLQKIGKESQTRYEPRVGSIGGN